MPRSKAQFEMMKDSRKESILSNALILFATCDKVTTDLICNKAKCSHGLLYHYFKNPKDVLEQLLSLSIWTEYEKTLYEDLTCDDVLNQLENFVSKLFSTLNTSVELMCFILISLKQRKIYDRFTFLINKGKEKNLIQNYDSDMIIESIFSIYSNFAIKQIKLNKIKQDSVPTSFILGFLIK